jgi:peptidoglycan/xylan/chitin deacetylase (PgdA/CDA1 family)
MIRFCPILKDKEELFIRAKRYRDDRHFQTACPRGIKARKPIASLSFDLDDKWSYIKTHGDPGWESFPTYLDLLVPRVLDFLKARNLIITFFIVGQDAALKKNYEFLRSITASGHEIGNHSFKHDPWLHLYSEKEIETEIASAEEHIERASGQRPVGFRGPGYSLTHAVLHVIARRGYRYDATTFPSLLAPIVRAYYYTTAKYSQEQRHAN